MKFISLLTIIAFGSFGLHSQNCDDLFISAYLEDGNDKALEIYNPTSGSISLDNYSNSKIIYKWKFFTNYYNYIYVWSDHSRE